MVMVRGGLVLVAIQVHHQAAISRGSANYIGL